MRRALAFALLLFPSVLLADPIRVATFNTELSRKGPGLMLRDIARGKDPQVAAVVAVIAQADADILALQGIDWDAEGRGLAALLDRLRDAGTDYPHRVFLRPNRGLATDLDLDGDGRRGGAGDAQGYGEFTGQSGIALVSRFPVLQGDIRDFSELLWGELPGATQPTWNGAPFPSPEAQAIQRLSSTGHWVVPVETPAGIVQVLTFQAGPPVFDGPEDRNGLRNRDEIRLWQVLLDGGLGDVPDRPFVIAGGANLDPWDSDGLGEAILNLLADPRVQDPRPVSRGAEEAGDQGHRSENALDTVDWAGPGRLRVDYVIPSGDWRVVNSGVFWPAAGETGHDAALKASRHRLVWVDLARD